MASISQTIRADPRFSRTYSIVVTSATKNLCPFALRLQLQRIWFAMQISHRGKYSIERMVAYEEYTRTASAMWVSLVCASTPLPMITTVFLVKLIPLQDPRDGWRVNYGIWIRIAVQAGAVAITTACQATYFHDGFDLSWSQLLVLFVAVAVSYTGTAIAVAAWVGFPIPFMATTMSPVVFAQLITCLYIVIGANTFRSILTQRSQLYHFIGFISAQMILLLVYPFYQVLFQAASANVQYELAALLLLPAIKSTMKNVVSFVIAHMEDMVPEAVIFTVDFFNAIYVSTSMQNATSTITIAALMIVDFSQTAMALHDLYQRTNDIINRLQTIADMPGTRDSILDIAISLCSSPDKVKNQRFTYIRLKSCLPYRLSASNKVLLKELEKYFNKPICDLVQSSSAINASLLPSIPRSLSAKFHAIFTGPATVHPSKTVLPPHIKTVLESHSDALSETLRLLFTTECLILAEYLEATMPVLYATFMVVMLQLPNGEYHSELLGVNSHNISTRVQSILIYALLELTSLILLAVLLKRKGGFNVMYQLAFTLETQRSLIQGKLLLWMLMVMGFRIVHFGSTSLSNSHGCINSKS